MRDDGLRLGDTIHFFLSDKRAGGRSEKTVDDYRKKLELFQRWLAVRLGCEDEVRFHRRAPKRAYLTKREAEVLLAMIEKRESNVTSSEEPAYIGAAHKKAMLPRALTPRAITRRSR